jgi:hypothetical protein
MQYTTAAAACCAFCSHPHQEHLHYRCQLLLRLPSLLLFLLLLLLLLLVQ